ncbi:MAG TPA: mannosyltransferase, partial [Chitinophagaceae bacterium]
MTNSLHIVCLDAPSPPNYGGAIDMYYKIEALAATGTKIILHYFDYKKDRNCLGLDHICQEVHAYKRFGNLLEHLKRTPYIISSRINNDLIKRLNQDDLPVLFEGLHTTGILPYLKNKSRRILVRMHNNEGTYYRQLAKTEVNFYRKLYYKLESIKIDNYQNGLDKNTPLACISVEDEREFKSKGFTNTFHLPAFIPYSNVSIEGKT